MSDLEKLIRDNPTYAAHYLLGAYSALLDMVGLEIDIARTHYRSRPHITRLARIYKRFRELENIRADIAATGKR